MVRKICIAIVSMGVLVTGAHASNGVGVYGARSNNGNYSNGQRLRSYTRSMGTVLGGPCSTLVPIKATIQAVNLRQDHSAIPAVTAAVHAAVSICYTCARTCWTWDRRPQSAYWL